MAAPMRIFRVAKKISACVKLREIRDTRVTRTVQNVRMVPHCRLLCTDKTVTAAEIKKGMESLTDKFTEARELMDDARESIGTVYFSEDMADAQQAVNETLDEYRNFLNSLSDKQKQVVISNIGLRMEELKAQKAAIEETLKE